VVHHHADPYDPAVLRDFFDARRYALCVATYGRLRAIAQETAGKVERFISAGGVPAYRGYMYPEAFEPAGLPVPTGEDAPKVRGPEDDDKGWRILRTEETVFECHPGATHVRYPYVYGRHQPIPCEWADRCAASSTDGRSYILPDGGLTLHHMGYAANVAHGMLLAVDRPENARGRIYKLRRRRGTHAAPAHGDHRRRAGAPARDRVDAVGTGGAGTPAGDGSR